MGKTTKAIVVRVGQSPQIEEISCDYRSQEIIVGGLLTYACIGDFILWANDEAERPNLPFNRGVESYSDVHWVYGDFFVPRENADGNTPLTEEHLREFSSRFIYGDHS